MDWLGGYFGAAMAATGLAVVSLFQGQARFMPRRRGAGKQGMGQHGHKQDAAQQGPGLGKHGNKSIPTW